MCYSFIYALSYLKSCTPPTGTQVFKKYRTKYFGHLMRQADSLEKALMLGKTEGRRRRGRQRTRWLDGITDLMGMSKLWGMVWTGMPGVLQSMGLQRVGRDWVTSNNNKYQTRRPVACLFKKQNSLAVLGPCCGTWEPLL